VADSAAADNQDLFAERLSFVFGEGLAVGCPLSWLRHGTRAAEGLERVDVEVEHGDDSEGRFIEV